MATPPPMVTVELSPGFHAIQADRCQRYMIAAGVRISVVYLRAIERYSISKIPIVSENGCLGVGVRPQKQRLACFRILRRIHMPQQIVESSVFRSRAEIEILDSVANAVSRVGRSMSIAGIRRRLRHLDTKVPEPYGKLRERVGCRAAVTLQSHHAGA
jgi:hypothetical protein